MDRTGALVLEGFQPFDHGVESAQLLFGNPLRIDTVAVEFAHRLAQAAGRGDHIGGVAMGHRQLGIGIDLHQRFQVERVPRVLEGPAPGIIALQQLHQPLVIAEGRAVVGLVEPCAVAGDVELRFIDLRAEARRHRELALGR